MIDYTIVVPWYKPEQIIAWLDAWGLSDQKPLDTTPPWLLLERDVNKNGCAVTKNQGIALAQVRGADAVIVLDDDCFPVRPGQTLTELAEAHLHALEVQPVEMFQRVTTPPSRGTPYGDRGLRMPVAASMGFWDQIGDYCAVRQLAHAEQPMLMHAQTIYQRWFPLCGMNLAFRPREWAPWCRFINVPRFDDIWMGWLWQKEAWRRGYCFNLGAPGTMIRHARQSNAWTNLIVEARHLEANENLWRKIAVSPDTDYDTLCGLLPKDKGGSDR